MFWKGRKNKGDLRDSSLDVSYDLDRRQFFRVNPDPLKPVRFSYMGDNFPVEDISAGGFSFPSQHRFTAGGQITGVLRLPSPLEPVPLRVEVIDHNRSGVVRTRIVKVKDLDRERIHYYVLNRQKEELEARKPDRPPFKE